MRVIARLDIKNEFLIKGIHLEGLRKLGDPHRFALNYCSEGIDEILFMDSVASLYGRNNLYHLIEKVTKNIFVPITLGGGVRTLEDIGLALKAGADKVAINSAAVSNPKLISECAQKYGSQCCVASIEAKRVGKSWLVYVETGREKTEIDAIEWASQLENLGAGEIIVTSIDQEGTKKGFDLELINAVTSAVKIPVIGCGGAGNAEHLKAVKKIPYLSAVALASVLHYDLMKISEIKSVLNEN